MKLGKQNIEILGRGRLNIVNYCFGANLPEPVYEDKWGRFAVIFQTIRKSSV